MTEKPTMAAKDFARLRPYYLMLTFWGEKFRQYFYTLCLPSLLSPNNLPVLQQVRGSKLIIATTENDWVALERTPLFQLLSTYVEPYFINIGYPPPHVPIQLHMSKGHALAARKANEDGAYAGFLAPDLVVSDGLVKTCLTHAAAGKKVVLAQALRFAMEPVIESLLKHNHMKPDVPMTLPPRFLGGLATRALHSEILRYDFESPYFDNYPIWSYWRVPSRECLVMHTVSWALLLGSYDKGLQYHDDFLETSTIDAFYVDKNFAHLRHTGEMHMITDSDEGLFMSLTPEADSSYPLRKQPSVHKRYSYYQRLRDMQRFLSSDVLDPFRRWAYQVPVFFHGDDLDILGVQVAKRAAVTVSTALDWKSRLVRSVYFISWVFLKYVIIRTIAQAFGRLSRPHLRLAMRAVPRSFVRPVVFRLAFGRDHQSVRAIPELSKGWLRVKLGPVIVPVFGRLSRQYLRLAMRAIPRRFTRSIIYRLVHQGARRRIPLRVRSSESRGKSVRGTV